MRSDERRNLSEREKDEKYDEQGGKCSSCGDGVSRKHAEFHHEFQYSDGGPSEKFNISMVDKNCHKELTDQQRGDEFGKRSGSYTEKRARKFIDDFK